MELHGFVKKIIARLIEAFSAERNCNSIFCLRVAAEPNSSGWALLSKMARVSTEGLAKHCIMSGWRRDLQASFGSQQANKMLASKTQPMSCSKGYVTAVNFRPKASALPLFCVFELQDAFSCQASYFWPIFEFIS